MRLLFANSIILLLLVLHGRAIGGDNDDLTAEQTVDLYYNRLVTHVADGNDLNVNRVAGTIEDLFDWDRLAQQILQKRWTKLHPAEKEKFIEALKLSVSDKLLVKLNNYNNGSLPTLSLDNQKNKPNFAELEYSISKNGNREEFTIYMLKYSDGKWKVSNLKSGDESLLRYYYSLCDRLSNDYSFEFMIAELNDQGYVVLEDFESSQVGRLPSGWTWKDSDKDKHKPYVVRQENGNKYLAAEDNGESVILGKDVKWNLNEYPYVSFRWRGHKIPEGGDERYGRTVDSAAGIYFIYQKKFIWIPESVKYVWSSTLAVGSAMRRSGPGRPWMIVAESGREHLNEWRTYVFDLREAYRKTFGGDPPDKPIGIGILSDANSTNSKAYADYDDIRALRQADADSGIEQFLEAE